MSAKARWKMSSYKTQLERWQIRPREMGIVMVQFVDALRHLTQKQGNGLREMLTRDAL
jgi:hypothetical protein